MSPGAPARRPLVGLILPARDEEEALPLVLAELPPGVAQRVVVVNNGSRDRTARVAQAAGAEVVDEPRLGYGQACLAGIAALERPGPGGARALRPGDVVAFLDADHSDYPEELPAIVGPILAGAADFVIGSRILGGADMRALLPQAWFGNRLACTLMRLLFGARYSDLGPFRALRYEALSDLGMADRTFGWTIEMQLKAHALGLRVLEVPVRYRPRIGRSKITGTALGTLRAGAKILGWIFAWRVRLWLTPTGSPTFRSPARDARR
jgi:glycosyltransferase involved in cell wall biosynthesis